VFIALGKPVHSTILKWVEAKFKFYSSYI
jgi:hypothetical protein